MTHAKTVNTILLTLKNSEENNNKYDNFQQILKTLLISQTKNQNSQYYMCSAY